MKKSIFFIFIIFYNLYSETLETKEDIFVVRRLQVVAWNILVSDSKLCSTKYVHFWTNAHEKIKNTLISSFIRD